MGRMGLLSSVSRRKGVDMLATMLRFGPADHGRLVTDEELSFAEYECGLLILAEYLFRHNISRQCLSLTSQFSNPSLTKIRAIKSCSIAIISRLPKSVFASDLMPLTH